VRRSSRRTVLCAGDAVATLSANRRVNHLADESEQVALTDGLNSTRLGGHTFAERARMAGKPGALRSLDVCHTAIGQRGDLTRRFIEATSHRAIRAVRNTRGVAGAEASVVVTIP
jgi:hypothetical protein